ncbi:MULTISPECIES: hypothetical protein [unclassified Caballeronia]|uniref:hypothetical protein n=1 Tax=unclassified Caballeronia TaxID=2646786 RepID=UPI002027A24F|nr:MULTISPECIES: hypothetical protein [unclassified Caballeronia]MDR5801659.1 hypothetical protein [Caballeronia sp. LZ001]
MMANARVCMLLLCAIAAGPVCAASCYSDGDVVTLEGTAARQAPRQAEADAKPAWVLTLARPICVLSQASGQAAPQQSNVSTVQVIDAIPTENARIRLTGKLVTGNVSAYYAVPTAIWVLKERVISNGE